MYSESHLSDQDLVLAADGELLTSRAAEVARHLERCWPCRARQQELEDAVVNFVRLYRAELDSSLPPSAGPKALLRVRLNQAAATVRSPWWTRWRHMFDWRDVTALPDGADRWLAFVGDGGANVYALDASTGEPKWKTKSDSMPFRASPEASNTTTIGCSSRFLRSKIFLPRIRAARIAARRSPRPRRRCRELSSPAQSTALFARFPPKTAAWCGPSTQFEITRPSTESKAAEGRSIPLDRRSPQGCCTFHRATRTGAGLRATCCWHSASSKRIYNEDLL